MEERAHARPPACRSGRSHEDADLAGQPLQMLGLQRRAHGEEVRGQQPGSRPLPSRLQPLGRGEGLLADVVADVHLLGVEAELAGARPHALGARGDAAAPDLRVLLGGVADDPVGVGCHARVGGCQALGRLAVHWGALVRFHKDMEEPVRPVVKLYHAVAVLHRLKADAAHVLHLVKTGGLRGRDVGHAHGVGDAGAAAGDPAGQAVDQAHHGARDVGPLHRGVLDVDLSDRGLGDKRDVPAVEGEAVVGCVVAEIPLLGTRQHIHEPLANDLAVETTDEAGVGGVRRATEAVGALDVH
mmetsp:Transcript_73800/g.209030  ORF Transcript_73800/g.209030 Transcript_73800/m.209030 type:complete len:299 (+) Transcript_73800:283-1179(+)